MLLEVISITAKKIVMYNLNEIRNIALDKCKIISLDPKRLPLLDRLHYYCNYLVYIKFDCYHYYHSDRGAISELKITTNYQELLFWIFRDATHYLAFEYELKHRVEDQDSRIIAFTKHIEILENLNLQVEFVEQLKLYYKRLLKKKLF